MNSPHQSTTSTQRLFRLYCASGIGLLAGVGILAVTLVPNIASFAGITLARLVQTCSDLLSAVTGRDIFLSSFNIIMMMGIVLLLITIIGTLVQTTWKTARYVRKLRSKAVPLSPRIRVLAAEFPSLSITEVQDDRTFVLSAGWLEPRVYISTALVRLLNDAELQSVLHHEAHHCEQRDGLRLVIVYIFKRVFWFVPGMQKFARSLHALFEISADEHAIRKMGSTHALSAALVKVIYRGSLNPSPAFIPAFSLVDDRIDRLLNAQYRPRTRATVIVPAVVAVFFIFSGLLSQSSLAAPRVEVDGMTLHTMSQSSVCPQFVPELLMSAPQNTLCVHPATDTSDIPTCPEVQSQAR